MRIIKIEHPHHFQSYDFPPLTMALGFFDGIHKGHQEVIKTAVEVAKKNHTKSAVMTFDPHPSVVLGKNKSESVQYITPLEEKIELINSLNIDYLYVVHFTKDFSNLLPQEFVTKYILDLNVKHAIAGFDFTYGKFGKGTMETLKEHANGLIDVTVIPKKVKDGQKISSTYIRECLNNGDIVEANHLLGRFFTNGGTVIHGEKRGRLIGYPTANIEIDRDYIVPMPGIYIVRVLVDDAWFYGSCSVGYNPTFNDQDNPPLSIEVYILDFDKTIYGKHVKIEWHKRLRGEIKFPGVEELVLQIKKDVEDTKEYLDKVFK